MTIHDFKTLVQNNNEVWNHHRNIQTLSIEIVKTKNVLAPSIMDSVIKRRNTTYNLGNFQKKFEKERKRTVYFGLETFIYRSPQLLSLLTEYMTSLKEVQVNGFVISVQVDCVKDTFKM